MNVDSAISENELVERIHARDATLWGQAGTPELADRLGWLDAPERMLAVAPEIESWAAEVHASGLTETVLLGMGGSSLGPEVLRRAFGRPLTMLDSTDPAAVAVVVRKVDLDKTMFVVSSKSGGTIETMSQFEYFWELTGHDADRFTVVTDPGSPLADRALTAGLARVWLADPEIGGRFSVLSHFGLVPAALAGIPLHGLLESAVAEMRDCRAHADENSGLALGLELGRLTLDGRDKVTFVIGGCFASFGLWAEQLIAESTGKNGRGILPVVGEPVAAPEAYGDDRVFVHIRADSTYDDAIAALADADQPVIEIDGYEGAAELGALFYMFEFATAVAGCVLDVNPFDQPNVQSAKDATAAVLESGDYVAPFDDAAELPALLDGIEPGGYVAVLGYMAPGEEIEEAIVELREAIRARTGAATSFGYGPRYLHSTGQLHKGGATGGVFVQLVHDG
ncbi:MAG: hypothetical protein HZB14_04055, partial [Actinobacteria bacterium]|nr:hypothetical protein [Actinomycetota bacterium]